MHKAKPLSALLLIAFVLLTVIPSGLARQASGKPAIEIQPGNTTVEAEQKLKLSVVSKDASGKTSEEKATAWFSVTSDIAAVDESGMVTFFNAGQARIGAIVKGGLYTTTFTVKPARVSKIEIRALSAPMAVGGAVQLTAKALTANGSPRNDVTLSWSSDNPSVATIDDAGLVLGLKPGKATLTAKSESASSTTAVEIIANPVRHLALAPKTKTARAGDVVHFTIEAHDAENHILKTPAIRWSVSGEGATVFEDGAFVAEKPGSYVVTASSGEHTAIASVVVSRRQVGRELSVVGRIPHKEVQTAEQWIFGNYAYVSTIADRLSVYDISDPAKPKLTDTVKVDARITNDIVVTPDGKIGVMSREGASNRKNGIVFFDTSDPAHPKIISEYTATVTGGVHSSYVDGHYVYLTDDATGSMRVIDFKDVKNPKEVARWETQSPLVVKTTNPDGDNGTGGRYLHDVQVVDGLAYLAYWRDGVVILDVGKGIKGGSPENPQFVSQIRFNYSELYSGRWIAGAHAVFRYKNYVFIGDEVFPDEFNVYDTARLPVRGIVHVVDVTDITKPRKVAEYEVPEAGSHNIWVKDDILYMGYYSGGGRIVDVSGELRGDLYRQGREIAKLYTGDTKGFRPHQQLTWGAQPHGDLIFFNDINSGIWIVKLGKPKDRGLTQEPGT